MAKTEIFSINVYDEGAYRPFAHRSGMPTLIRVMGRSSDDRIVAFAAWPKVALSHTREKPAGHDEVFYMLEGTATCIPAGGGEPRVWGPGDLVFVPRDALGEMSYSDDLRCIIFQWSEDGPLDNAERMKGE